MARRVAKELLRIATWLARVADIARRGRSDYLAGPLLQEGGVRLLDNMWEGRGRGLRALKGSWVSQ